MRLLFLLHALFVSFGGCADRFLLFPSTQPIDSQGATSRMLASGVQVWTDRSASARNDNMIDAFVLEFTGNATRAEQIAHYVAGRWQPHRVEVWVMNYPGYGGSTGPAKLTSIAPAALATFDELKRGVGDKPIFVCGNSLGGAVAMSVAAQRDVHGLILHNPPAIRSIILRKHGWWNLWLLAGPVALGVPDELDALANAPKIRVPAIFITADHDTLVPPRFQDEIVAKYRGEVQRIHLKDKGHWHAVDRPDEVGALSKAIEWLLAKSDASHKP